MIQRWKRSVTVAQEHETLAYFEGEWQTETQLFASGHDQAPIHTRGEAIGERLFGGRFLQMLYRGTTAVPAGPGAFDLVEAEGLHTLGFDTYRNLFVGTWIDSLSTSLIHFTGTLCDDGDQQVLNLYGQQDEPMMGIVGRAVKYVYRLRDESRFDFELYDLVGCTDHLLLKMAYTRTPDAP